MRITLQLRSSVSRLAIGASVTVGAAVFISLSAARFVISTITAPASGAEAAIIEGAAAYFPNSAPAQARMASHLIEYSVDLTEDHEQTAERAFYYASRAVAMAPYNYEYRMLLGAAKELRGDLAGAEEELRAALKLAPYRVNIHWRLANLLLRQDKLDQASAEFRLASEADPELLIPTLNILWQATNGKLEALNAVVGEAPRPRMAFAQFLAGQEKFESAVEIAKGLAPQLILELPESGRLIESLVSAGRIELASDLWRAILSAEDNPLMWNEGFESSIRGDLAQFDWNLNQSKYARVGITTATAKTGQRSLKVSYNGVNTTTFNNEIRQLVRIKPGARYNLTCYVKAEKLDTPDGPQVAVTARESEAPIAKSEVIEAGSYDWRLLTLDFVAPSDSQAVVITLIQTPRFSYVEPTNGTLWFDDFALKEQSPGLPAVLKTTGRK